MPLNLFTIFLVMVRMIIAQNLVLGFVMWNLFLAGLPLLFSYCINQVTEQLTRWGLFGLWLLFFPNSAYIVTDLFHLEELNSMPPWYDSLLLFTAAFNGIVMGIASFLNIEQFLKRNMSPRMFNTVVFSLFALGGYGIYLGRYKRWNSWDIFANPLSLLQSILHDLRNPLHNTQWWSMSLLFATWMFIVYRYCRHIKPEYALHADGSSSAATVGELQKPLL